MVRQWSEMVTLAAALNGTKLPSATKGMVDALTSLVRKLPAPKATASPRPKTDPLANAYRRSRTHDVWGSVTAFLTEEGRAAPIMMTTTIEKPNPLSAP
ncbi:hypothetical protein [Streptomyces sp. NPDC004134]|uniref:hypothetical protein n=1 Tax=Streptomyces sp. NPDC004134 TaxID=3364691 RepID=UPI00369970AF